MLSSIDRCTLGETAVFVSLKPGDEVICDGRRYRLSRPLDFTHVLGHNLASGEIEYLSIEDVRPGTPPFPKQPSEAVAAGPDLG